MREFIVRILIFLERSIVRGMVKVCQNQVGAFGYMNKRKALVILFC